MTEQIRQYGRTTGEFAEMYRKFAGKKLPKHLAIGIQIGTDEDPTEDDPDLTEITTLEQHNSFASGMSLQTAKRIGQRLCEKHKTSAFWIALSVVDGDGYEQEGYSLGYFTAKTG